VVAQASGTNRYDEWLRNVAKNLPDDPFEAAIAWAKLGILTSRDRNKPQPMLDLEPLANDELEARDVSGLPLSLTSTEAIRNPTD
jgi:hypothetical protein